MRCSARGAGSFLIALLCACTQSIAVLGPGGGDAAAAPGNPMPRGDGGLVPDPDDVDEPSAACGGCGVAQICAADRCVDALGVRSLDASFMHICRVADGRLACWGDNEDGQLGAGDRAQRDRPMRVGNENDWLQVSAGEHHSCGLRAPGRLYCWGKNSSGQLALGDVQTRLSPVAVESAVVWREVACGGDSCCALDADAALWCWGDNLEGKLGQDDPFGSPDGTRPVVVEPGSRWRTVRIGQGQVCAIKSDGGLYCWGRNTDAQLGIGSLEPGQIRAPTQVGSDNDWVELTASQHHTCAIKSDGTLWCWGTNAFFELAAQDPAMRYPAPVQVGSERDWTAVVVSWFHSCALKRDGRLFCWGRAIEGQLGQGGSVDPLPQPNEVLMPARWQRIALGNFYTCGVDAAGALYCWGANEHGQLGLGDDLRRHEPTLVP